MNKVDAEYHRNPTVGINPPATFGGRDEVDKRREGMEAALFLRGNPRASADMIEKGREFAGLTLVDMARECLNAAGVKTRGMERHEIARVALQGRKRRGGVFRRFHDHERLSKYPRERSPTRPCARPMRRRPARSCRSAAK